MVEQTRPPASRRADYRHFHPIATRWMDNDAFGHLNNVVYYSLFDTAVTVWMLGHGLMRLQDGPMWVVAETGCRFRSEVAFPEPLQVGIRLGRLGRTSVRWELAVFRDEVDEASAEGFFVHVHVDRVARRPVTIPDEMRRAVEGLRLLPSGAVPPDGAGGTR